ncbi:MAG: hypothetical protein SGILL_010590 [Bacillariaceae sp.]
MVLLQVNHAAKVLVVVLLLQEKLVQSFFCDTALHQKHLDVAASRQRSSTELFETVEKTGAEHKAPTSEIDRRRNLAIISHPDSGKTTMTEKLLLYGGALQQAGAVRQKAEQRATQSDFMAMEQERGISISSTVMNFDYEGFRLNILDTPGHQE